MKCSHVSYSGRSRNIFLTFLSLFWPKIIYKSAVMTEKACAVLHKPLSFSVIKWNCTPTTVSSKNRQPNMHMFSRGCLCVTHMFKGMLHDVTECQELLWIAVPETSFVILTLKWRSGVRMDPRPPYFRVPFEKLSKKLHET